MEMFYSYTNNILIFTLKKYFKKYLDLTVKVIGLVENHCMDCSYFSVIK